MTGKRKGREYKYTLHTVIGQEKNRNIVTEVFSADAGFFVITVIERM
jgi:hypothetical protein